MRSHLLNEIAVRNKKDDERTKLETERPTDDKRKEFVKEH